MILHFKCEQELSSFQITNYKFQSCYVQFLTFRFLRSERDEIDADIRSDIVNTILYVHIITILSKVKIILQTFLQLFTSDTKRELKSKDAENKNANI